MFKKFYTLIVLNETTPFNKSIKINLFLLYFIIIVCIIFFSFSIFGIYKVFIPHPKQSQFNQLLDVQQNTMDLLKNLVKSDIIDSTMLENYELNHFLSINSNLKPINPPVQGIVTKGLIFNENNPHHGIDIAATLNSDIIPTQKGIVLFADSLEHLGNTIIIAHPNNYFSLYSHLNKIISKQHQHVENNQIIGTIGQSGNSDGPHLHFELWQNSTILDPRDFIKEYKLKDVSIK